MRKYNVNIGYGDAIVRLRFNFVYITSDINATAHRKRPFVFVKKTLLNSLPLKLKQLVIIESLFVCIR